LTVYHTLITWASLSACNTPYIKPSCGVVTLLKLK
jgi:hypothetical protein